MQGGTRCLHYWVSLGVIVLLLRILHGPKEEHPYQARER